ncbi:MAG TPA: tetratricopeptide repeat protein [Planctomycetaceae bacterium]|nr:tetratricopeptide repeat protein [Planctomycetaceae bacterium]
MSDPTAQVRHPAARRGWLAVGGAALIVTLATGWAFWPGETIPEGISPEQYRAALASFQQKYHRQPRRMDVLSLLGETAVADGNWELARRCFHEIPNDDRDYGRSARLQEAQVCLNLNHAQAAEEAFRQFLSLGTSAPSVERELAIEARRRLSYILSVELRFEDRRDVLSEMHARGEANLFESKQLFFPNLLIWNSPAGRQRLSEFLKDDPQNLSLQIAHGRYLTADGRLSEAHTYLSQLGHQNRHDPNCQAAVLENLFELNAWEELKHVAGFLDEYSPDEPWLLTRMRGELALHEERWDDAVREFERVLAEDPANPWSTMGLARACAARGDSEAQKKWLERSLVLSNIRVNLINIKESNPAAAMDVAAACEKIGMPDAAAAFQKHAERIRRRLVPSRP